MLYPYAYLTTDNLAKHIQNPDSVRFTDKDRVPRRQTVTAKRLKSSLADQQKENEKYHHGSQQAKGKNKKSVRFMIDDKILESTEVDANKGEII